MKKLILTVTMTGFIFAGLFAQTSNNQTAPLNSKQQHPNHVKLSKETVNVPDAVKQKFASAFPSIMNPKWGTSKEGGYNAHFKDGNEMKYVDYDASGNVLASGIAQPVSSLPASINDYISKNYSGQSILKAFKETNDKGETYFRVKTTGKLLYFDMDGKFMHAHK